MNNKNDLTQGVIWKKILIYFFPLALGTIFQQLYSAVDGIIVGKYLGTVALAAVGGSASLVFQALVNFFVGLSGGAAIMIAQYYGARNNGRLEATVHTSILFSMISGIVISVLGVLLTPQILLWMKTPDESMDEAAVYLRIIFVGAMFQLVYNMAAAILRAVGDSKTPFIYLSVSCVLNIVLDLLAVVVLKMDVAGAAYATVLSQIICCVVSVRKLVVSGNEPYALSFGKLRIEKGCLLGILKIGLPMALQSLMYSITNILIQVGVNTLGTITVASWAVLNKMDGFFWGLMSAANITVSNFIGQNFGKGSFDRMKMIVKSSMAIFEIVAVSFGILYYSTLDITVPLFSSDIEVIDLTKHLSWFFVPFYFIWVINEVLGGALRGEGCTLIPFCIAAFSACFLRILWLLTVFRVCSTIEILSVCYPVTWVVASTAMFVYYVLHNRKRKLTLS